MNGLLRFLLSCKFKGQTITTKTWLVAWSWETVTFKKCLLTLSKYAFGVTVQFHTSDSTILVILLSIFALEKNEVLLLYKRKKRDIIHYSYAIHSQALAVGPYPQEDDRCSRAGARRRSSRHTLYQ
jgi:hypothetical protein